jgi:hypothetical protein
MVREEPNAPSAAMAAATMNNKQNARRKRGDVNAWFDVIQLFFSPLHGAASGKLPDAALIEHWFVFPTAGN